MLLNATLTFVYEKNLGQRSISFVYIELPLISCIMWDIPYSLVYIGELKNKFCYLSFELDAYSRDIVGKAVGKLRLNIVSVPIECGITIHMAKKGNLKRQCTS